MIRRPPRSTLDRSSAASDVYKRQLLRLEREQRPAEGVGLDRHVDHVLAVLECLEAMAVSYTHLRAHETVLDLVCRLLLEKKQNESTNLVSHSLK